MCLCVNQRCKARLAGLLQEYYNMQVTVAGLPGQLMLHCAKSGTHQMPLTLVSLSSLDTFLCGLGLTLRRHQNCSL